MLSSTGTLQYSVKDDYYRLVVLVDPELHRFFRSLVPKQYVCQPQRYPPHITVVRGEKPLTDAWLKHQGQAVTFDYDSYLHHDEVYWWFNCHSPHLLNIRIELGLPSSYRLTRPPDGTDCFHSTIGNSKRLT